MLEIYRALCDKELEDMIKFNSLSWASKFKWFGTEEFVKTRVQDNQFNNSKYVTDRYKNLVKFVIDDNSLNCFDKCGYKEYMLSRRKANNVRILSWEIIS